MTKYIVTIEDKDALEWLKNLIGNSLTKQNSQAVEAAYPHLVVWDEALSNVAMKRDIEPKPATTAKRARRKKTPKPKPDPSGLTCHIHPTYGGIRSPRTDCTMCWGVYERLNGKEETRRKKTAFDRKKSNG